jgi:hypothetical protein
MNLNGLSTDVVRVKDATTAVNRVTRVRSLLVGGTRRKNKKGDLDYENHPTRRYLPRTQARSWSLLTSGRGNAYRRDRTPPAYTRSEIGRLTKRRRGQRKLAASKYRRPY